MTDFDSSETSGVYMEALQLVDDLRNEIYTLVDAGQPVDELINTLFDIEEELLQRSQ